MRRVFEVVGPNGLIGVCISPFKVVLEAAKIG